MIIINKIGCWDGINAVLAEEFTQSLHVFYPGVVGEESVVADAMEASRQHMNEKAPDELVGGQGHGLVTITPLGAIVLPLEGNTVLIAGNEPAVADGDPMGVAGQIGEHGLRTGERTLGIDHPVDVAYWCQIIGEVPGLDEVLVRTEELQAAGVVSDTELFQQQPPKQSREHPHR